MSKTRRQPLVRIADKGDTGDLLVTGDVIGSMYVAGDRALTVQSSNVAEIDVISGPGSNASCRSPPRRTETRR